MGTHGRFGQQSNAASVRFTPVAVDNNNYMPSEEEEKETSIGSADSPPRRKHKPTWEVK